MTERVAATKRSLVDPSAIGLELGPDQVITAGPVHVSTPTERSSAGWKSEPPPDQSAIVPVQGQPGACYRVGVSDVNLQGLRASVGFEAGIGWWVVNVSLNKSQSSAFNRMAARDYHKVVASLVEGVALMEARVQVTDFQGSFAIASPYMTKKSAERIARQLDPA